MFFEPMNLTIILGIMLTLMLGTGISTLFLYHRAKDLNPEFEEKEHLKKDIESQQRTLSDLQAMLNKLLIEESNAKRIIAEGTCEREWLEGHRDEIAQLRNQIASTKKDLDTIQEKYTNMEDDLKKKSLELQDVTGINKGLLDENNHLENSIKSLKEQEPILRSNIEKLKNEEKKVHQDLLSQQSSLSDVQSQINNELINLKQGQDKCKKIEKEINDLKESYQQKDAELRERYQKKNNELEESYQETLSRFQENRKNLEREFGELNEHYNAKNKEIKDELSKKETELDDIRRRTADAKKELHDCEIEIIDKGPISDEACWSDLDRPFIGKEKKSKMEMSEEKWLNDFKEKLSSSGIIFHDRIINAFHTGLKVADTSPLVVLAGISGTGKSLLPQLYAHAIGMNFLQMAVQPRWDNPQDMFGFFNYMERRYKATELSRLLWQFDIFNNKTAKELYQKTKTRPMNLVLLDEMNIAKVEYYFSDMLSKLEIRRNIDEKKQEQRVDAEIELECGALQKEDESRRMFIASNTLFVGTMNEDESTQSLSDKVMDRANVLRFGKPSNLKVQSDTSTFLQQYDNDIVMDYSDWKKHWVRKDSSYTKKLNDFLEKINEKLVLVGRPFAYRVANAINAYIANYPDKGDIGYRNALADQIEMKILPKLNGLDKETSSNVRNCFNEIADLINSLGDKDLSDAFDSVRNSSDSPFFQWKGVTRKQ